jgi:hypothetical protein
VKTPPGKPVASFLVSDCLICSGERKTPRDEPVASIVQTASLPIADVDCQFRLGRYCLKELTTFSIVPHCKDELAIGNDLNWQSAMTPSGNDFNRPMTLA